MDIFLSINNREQVIQLPVVPSEYEISSPQNNETFETINQGELKLIGLKGLRTISFSSFFPNKRYPFRTNYAYKGYQFVRLIERWRERRLPVRLIITDTPINIAVAINDFSYKEQDGTRDVYYSITLEEFPFVKLGRS